MRKNILLTVVAGSLLILSGCDSQSTTSINTGTGGSTDTSAYGEFSEIEDEIEKQNDFIKIKIKNSSAQVSASSQNIVTVKGIEQNEYANARDEMITDGMMAYDTTITNEIKYIKVTDELEDPEEEEEEISESEEVSITSEEETSEEEILPIYIMSGRDEEYENAYGDFIGHYYRYNSIDNNYNVYVKIEGEFLIDGVLTEIKLGNYWTEEIGEEDYLMDGLNPAPKISTNTSNIDKGYSSTKNFHKFYLKHNITDETLTTATQNFITDSSGVIAEENFVYKDMFKREVHSYSETDLSGFNSNSYTLITKEEAEEIPFSTYLDLFMKVSVGSFEAYL